MDNLTMFAGLAGITALWSQIRGLFDRVRALFITRAVLHGEVAHAVSAYIFSNGKVLQWGDRYIRSGGDWVRPLGCVAEVAFEHPPMQPMLAWLGARPLLFCCPREGRSGGASTPEDQDLLILTGLRGWLDIDNITKLALEHARAFQSSGKRYRVMRIGASPTKQSVDVYGHGAPMAASAGSRRFDLKPGTRLLHWQHADIGAPVSTTPFGALALCAQGDKARRDFEQWVQLKSWYRDRGIPWRRGHLYYGPPGTGKTSMARALAQQADMPVFSFDLSTLDNHTFEQEWQQMQENTPCMALLEDIDGVFQGRVNVLAVNRQSPSLTFDCLLNALGGIQTCDGVFVVVTTNKPETLDAALGTLSQHGISRPGRLDAAYCLELPGPGQRLHILRRIMGVEAVEQTDVRSTDGMSSAQVTEYAIQQALHKAWSLDSAQPAS